MNERSSLIEQPADRILEIARFRRLSADGVPGVHNA